MKLAYIDSSLWITRVEGLPQYREIINKQFKKLAQDGWYFCISEAVLLEVLSKPIQNNQKTNIEIYNKIFEQTKILKSFSAVFKEALSISHTENLKGMDAIHISIAIHHGCMRFVSTDPHFKNLKIISAAFINLDDSDR